MFARIVYGLCVFCVLSSLVPLLAGSAEAATVLGNEVKRKASDPGEGDFYGWSVALSGDTAVVSAYKDDDGGADSGSVNVLQRDAGGVNGWGEGVPAHRVKGCANVRSVGAAKFRRRSAHSNSISCLTADGASSGA